MWKKAGAMNKGANSTLDLTAYLKTEGPGRQIYHRAKTQAFFHQGGPADAVFYLQEGRAKLTVLSKRGKEATVTLLAPGDFFGEEAIAGDDELRTVTAVAIVSCVVLKIERGEMLRILHQEPDFSRLFMKFVLTRGIRTQADLVDQLFNSSERRLARTLLLMADFGQPGEPITLIPEITQEALAEIIGTTRSRVSFFMNRFRKLGYIDYNGRIHVHASLLNMVLRDSLPSENATRPVILDPPPGKARSARRSKLV